MNPRTRNILIVLLIACAIERNDATAQSIRWIGAMSDSNSTITAVSEDGLVAAGYSHSSNFASYHAFRWTRSGGVSLLSNATGASNSMVFAMTPDGQTIVGRLLTDVAPKHFLAGRWKSNGEVLVLGVPNGINPTSPCLASDITDDGVSIVGQVADFTASYAFLWSEKIGFSTYSIDSINCTGAFASAISSSGDLVSGIAGDASNHNKAVTWNKSGSVEVLGDLEDTFSNVTSMSNDGSIIVGNGKKINNYSHAFRWTRTDGLKPLLPDSSGSCSASEISSDGSIIVGNMHVSGSDQQHAVLWRASGNVEDLNDAFGELAKKGTFFYNATAVSSSGRFIAGQARNLSNGSLEAFIIGKV